MIMGTPYRSCCLDTINVGWNLDRSAESFSMDDILRYSVRKEVYRPHICFGEKVDYDITISWVEVIPMKDGRFAFPIYECVPWYDDEEDAYFRKSSEGSFQVIGWCIKATNPFDEYPRAN